MLRVNDFFCGAGGMGLGFKQAGFRIAGAWDFDKYAVESYGNNVSPKVKQMDILQLKGEDIPYADVWIFGFPCQDISVAGKRAGMVKGKTRSGLFYEVMRLLDEIEQKPMVIIAENVGAVKPLLPEIEKEYIKQGYRMITALYNSKYWGLPQNRERYFIMGVRENLKNAFSLPVEQAEIKVRLSNILEKEVDNKYLVTNPNAMSAIKDAYKNFLCDTDLEPPRIKPLGIIKQYGENGKIHSPYGLVGALKATCYKNPKIVVDPITKQVRRLTPREYARLQGFPDSFKLVVSDTQLYKQFGNAVTVIISKAIATHIKQQLDNELGFYKVS
ncbi:DNA (cytosine-5-)-methyltransferase [Bacillus sonorensis]|uniref:DNA cytosine methyltransferase n=1 Tax=Bacillus sonorensis TaxID=119858 RepID=UPI001F017186|nr:DNA (cytosine-5-)-methyltransferase [Bacillus sonorensis]MCF7618558.1 DNA (cytosine-5-)-methyltransferase [Bacillus sonorensis]